MDDFTHRYGAGRPLTAPPPPPTGVLVSETGVSAPPPTLQQYTKHASRYGPDQVYETAVNVLTLKDLIELVHHLRTLEPTGHAHFQTKKDWKLTKEQRDVLAQRMEDAKYTMKSILRVTKG